jgi:hypothetical protein
MLCPEKSHRSPQWQPMKHDGSVYGARFDERESRVLSWSGDTVRIWDAATG